MASFIMLAIMSAIKRPWDGVNLKDFKTNETNKNERITSNINILTQGKYKFVVDDYVVDMHTKKGRMSGKTRKDFVEEGAIVVNEETVYSIPLFEKIYRES